MKIISDKKIVKFPRSSNSVKSVFKTAQEKAQEQGWNKIIIIGEGRTSGFWITSKMHDYCIIGLMEKIKGEVMDGY